MRKSIREVGCFLETVAVANANIDGSELEAAVVLDELLEKAAIQGITKCIQCDRCQSNFKVYHDGVVITDGQNNCDRPIDISKQADAFALRINIDNLAQPIIWPASEGEV